MLQVTPKSLTLQEVVLNPLLDHIRKSNVQENGERKALPRNLDRPSPKVTARSAEGKCHISIKVGK